MSSFSNSRVTSDISVAVLQKLNAHIIKKPKKTIVTDVTYVAKDNSLVSIVDLKHTVTILKQALGVVTFLALSNKITFIGVSDKESYHSIRSIFNLDAFFYPVYPWYPGLLTNLKKIRQSLLKQKTEVGIKTSGLNELSRIRQPKILNRQDSWTKSLHKLPSMVLVQNPTVHSRILCECLKVDLPAVAFNFVPALKNTQALYSICLNFSDPALFKLVLLLFKNQQYRAKFSRYIIGYRDFVASRR